MTTPRDGWDRDERELLEALGDEIEAVRARHEKDPPLSLLRAAGEDVLPEALETTAGEHLSNSAWSRALVEGLDDVEATLSAEDQDRLLQRIRRDARSGEGAAGSWTWLWRPVLAATSLAALGIVAWVTWQAARPGAELPGTPEGTIAVAPPPTTPPFELAIDKPEVKLSAAALTWRGRSGDDNQLLSDAREAFDAYRRGDYALAARAFTTLQSRYPESVEMAFYLGVSHLLQGEAEAAIRALEEAEALGVPEFADDIAWYRALAEHRAGKSPGAEARLASICRQAGSRSAQACEALERLRAASRPPG